MYISPHIHNQYTCIYHPCTQSIYIYIPLIYIINIHVYTTLIHHQYTSQKTVTYVGVNQGSRFRQTCMYHPIDTINIHVYTTHIHNQYKMYIPPHIHNQYTCICHPYTPSIYMYIPPLYTINIQVYTTLIHNQYTTHIHNQYTCI